jgi:hypothetical protein
MAAGRVTLKDVHLAHASLRAALDALAGFDSTARPKDFARALQTARNRATSALLLIEGLDPSEGTGQLRAVTARLCAELALYASHD